MALNIVTVLPIIASILFLFVAYRLFPKGQWLASWLRGTCVFLALLLALTLFLSVSEIASFRDFSEGRKIAQITVKHQSGKHYKAYMMAEGVPEMRTYDLYGDQWQLDAKVIKWSSYLEFFGLDAAYRLDRLSGRYERLQDELSSEASAHALYEESFLPDIWGLRTQYPWLPGIEARYGSGTYVPMADGAKYAIFLRRDGLYAKPLNNVAQESVSSWN